MTKIIMLILSVSLLVSQPALAKSNWQKIGKTRDGDGTFYVDSKLTDLATTDSRKKFHMLIDMDFTFGGMIGVFEGEIRIRSWVMNGEVDCAKESFSLFSSTMYGKRFATGDLLKDDQFEAGEYQTKDLDGDEHVRVIYDLLCGKDSK